MKKLFFAPIVLAFLLLFTATAFANEEVSNETAVYLINESTKAMGDVTSFNAVVDMDMNISVDSEEYPVDMDMQMLMDMAFDMEKGLYATYNITMPAVPGFDGEMAPVTMDLEVYADKEVMAIRMPGVLDQWEVMPADPSFEFALNMDTEEVAQMELNSFNDTYRYHKNAVLNGQDYYVVTSVLTEQDFLAIFGELSQMGLPFTEDDLAAIKEIFAMVNGDIVMDTYINKETMVSDYFTMTMDMEIADPTTGEAIAVTVDMNGTISDLNAVTLPVMDLPAPGAGLENLIEAELQAEAVVE
jgi:hypothetical protein